MIGALGRASRCRAIDPEAKKMIRAAGTTGAVGIEIALAICLGFLGGQFLDKKFNTTPWLTWIGFVAGVGASIKALIRVTRQYKKTLADETDPQKPPL